ncbi:MAG TPA: DUF362 domain-containing protein [Gemmatimonadaceae bacterium]|nr:DUF362 domain-containing protein [Gemmatimonadaceae bacterium]
MTTRTRSIHRRDFLRATAAGFAAIPLADHERLVRWLAARPSKVALVHTADRKQGVAAAIALFDPHGIRGKRVVIKPNFNSADPAPASTHNDTLAQLVTELHERGARAITLGESSGPPQTRGVMERKGIFDLSRDLRFDVVDYEQIPDGDWVFFASGATHWPEGFHLPRLVVDSEYNVSTCCLKTHGSGGVFTMSLKLSVGLTPKPARRTMHRSPDMRRMIAELNTAYRPNLVVLDGVAAFTDGGPSHGELQAGNVVLVGDDRVAVDAVGLAVLKDLGANDAIMHRGIWEQEQIARAVELGLGAPGPSAIEIVTGDPESRAHADRLRRILALG